MPEESHGPSTRANHHHETIHMHSGMDDHLPGMPVNICHVQAHTCKPVYAQKSAGEKHEAKMGPRGTEQPAAMMEGH